MSSPTREEKRLGTALLAATLAAFATFVWGALFAWVVDGPIGNILGREVAFTDVWIVSSLSLMFFSSIASRSSV